MFKRDFKKPVAYYIKKNKTPLICLAVLLVVGIVVACVFGMKCNFEFTGYNQFSVQLKETSNKYNTYASEIAKKVNSYGGAYDSYSVEGEGDDTKLVIRYLNNLSENDINALNGEIAEDLTIEVEKISAHQHAKGVVKNTDYIYTATAILVLLVVASLFAYFRYNGASALAIILSCFVGTLTFMSIGAIIRLEIGLSYFAMLIALNVIVMYFALDLFENIKEKSWLATDDYSQAIGDAVKTSKSRFYFITMAIMVVGVLMVLLAPNPIKYIALNLLFIAVVALACGLYAIPFVWSLFITKCKRRVKAQVEKNSEK